MSVSKFEYQLLEDELKKTKRELNQLKNMQEFEYLVGQEFKMPMKFGFDITESNIKSLKSDLGFILWALIKNNHLTPEDFDDEVMSAVEKINQIRPKNYVEFKAAISFSRLRQSNKYGSTYIEEFQTQILNDVYWLGIWFYIKNPQEFLFEYNNKIMQLNTKNFSFVNPQLFV